MRELIARLIKCGFSRELALFAAGKHGWNVQAFELYVEEIEADCQCEREDDE